ncbi:Zinc metalloprotease [uncultured archaeon]|nr:Zinc metalloprotease [uncultured archaeon]
MAKGRLVAEIMTRQPITAKPEITLLDCAKIMVKKRVGSVLLVENRKLVGFVSHRDILWAMIKKSQKDLSKIKAKDISPKKLITISPGATISEAMDKMKKSKYTRLPVVQNGNLVGMLTNKDILNFNPELYPEFEELEQIREEEKKLARMKKVNEEGFESEGVCEECGDFGTLYIIKGVNVCENCRNLIKE